MNDEMATSNKVTIFSVSTSACSLSAQIVSRVESVLKKRKIGVTEFNLFDGQVRLQMNSQDFQEYGSGDVYEDIREIQSAIVSGSYLIFVFPVWMYGPPSCLKGLLERVFRPHITFLPQHSTVMPLITSVSDIFVICTSGQKRHTDELIADPVKYSFNRLTGDNFGDQCKFHYLHLWGTDDLSSSNFAGFMNEVERSILETVQ